MSVRAVASGGSSVAMVFGWLRPLEGVRISIRIAAVEGVLEPARQELVEGRRCSGVVV